MKKNLFYLIFTSFILLISCLQTDSGEKAREADKLINDFIKKNKVPGMSVTILNSDGRLKYSQGFGFSNIENKIKVDPGNSIFRIGSFSKTLTARGFMKM